MESALARPKTRNSLSSSCTLPTRGDGILPSSPSKLPSSLCGKHAVILPSSHALGVSMKKVTIWLSDSERALLDDLTKSRQTTIVGMVRDLLYRRNNDADANQRLEQIERAISELAIAVRAATRVPAFVEYRARAYAIADRQKSGPPASSSTRTPARCALRLGRGAPARRGRRGLRPPRTAGLGAGHRLRRTLRLPLARRCLGSRARPRRAALRLRRRFACSALRAAVRRGSPQALAAARGLGTSVPRPGFAGPPPLRCASLRGLRPCRPRSLARGASPPPSAAPPPLALAQIFDIFVYLV